MTTPWVHAVLRHHRWVAGAGVAAWAVLAAGDVWGVWSAGAAVWLLLLPMGGLWGVWLRWQRERVVREAPLPQRLQRKLREAYPHLGAKDTALVERGLRQYFWACLRSQRRHVAMPSQAVDAMWHEFILHTQAYRDWCALALGRFLHHTPAEALGPRAHSNDGLRRAWYWACRDEAIDPRTPTRLPLLFALDAKLAIPHGFVYQPDCGRHGHPDHASGSATAHCGTHFSDSAYSGDADGFGGSGPTDRHGGGDGGDAGDGGGDGGGGD